MNWNSEILRNRNIEILKFRKLKYWDIEILKYWNAMRQCRKPQPQSQAYVNLELWFVLFSNICLFLFLFLCLTKGLLWLFTTEYIHTFMLFPLAPNLRTLYFENAFRLVSYYTSATFRNKRLLIVVTVIRLQQPRQSMHFTQTNSLI